MQNFQYIYTTSAWNFIKYFYARKWFENQAQIECESGSNVGGEVQEHSHTCCTGQIYKENRIASDSERENFALYLYSYELL